MTISILGCGWYGKALAQALMSNGNMVKGSATSAEKLSQLAALGIHPYLVAFNAESESFDAEFFVGDILVVSIPPKIRHGEGDGYLLKIKRIIDTINNQQVKKVIYISSTGVYGDSNREVNERGSPDPDTVTGRLLLRAEKLFESEAGFKTTIIRFAGLVGPGRHPGRFYAGKKDVPNGLSPVNLIHQQDCVGITMQIIQMDIFGALFNASSPDHPSKADFYRRATSLAGLSAPEFINELNNWKVVRSVRLSPILSYQFKIPSWEDCSFDE